MGGGSGFSMGGFGSMGRGGVSGGGGGASTNPFGYGSFMDRLKGNAVNEQGGKIGGFGGALGGLGQMFGGGGGAAPAGPDIAALKAMQAPGSMQRSMSQPMYDPRARQPTSAGASPAIGQLATMLRNWQDRQ